MMSMHAQPLGPSKRFWWIAGGAAATLGLIWVGDRLSDMRRADEPPPGPPTPDASPEDAPAAPAFEGQDAEKLASFLQGEAWLDQEAWMAHWDNNDVDAGPWLRGDGATVLRALRETADDNRLTLAGIRRRWIVICKYAAVPEADARQMWDDAA